jgi:hypothetical protein
MFDNNVFIKGSCRNVVENNVCLGYELQTNITYYRGIPLSMLEFVKVSVDGVEADVNAIRVSVDGCDWFTLGEPRPLPPISGSTVSPCTSVCWARA